MSGTLTLEQRFNIQVERGNLKENTVAQNQEYLANLVARNPVLQEKWHRKVTFKETGEATEMGEGILLCKKLRQHLAIDGIRQISDQTKLIELSLSMLSQNMSLVNWIKSATKTSETEIKVR
jgi:hypothetical protein